MQPACYHVEPVVLVVSLDSESLSWLDEHISQGALPHLAQLLRTGQRAPLDAVQLAGVAYPTLYTGLRPASLGIYFPLQWSPERQRVRPWTDWPFPPTVLERADQAGARVVLLDPPECPPLNLRHGFAASGVQFRARILLPAWSSDPAKSARLRQVTGPVPRADEVFGQPTAAGLGRLREALVSSPARLTRAAKQALADGPPDCLWLNCCAMHVAGHQFYDLGLLNDPAERQALAGTRLEVARGYDAMLGEVLAALPAGSQTLVFFAKGMGPVIGWVDLLPAMLARILGDRTAAPTPVKLVRSLIPQAWRDALASRLSDHAVAELTARLSNPRVDWRKTRAFTLPSDGPGFIRLNLQGRERDGVVREAERAVLLEEIRAGLASFVDDTGERCVDHLCEPAELYGPGPALSRFPDLLVFWRARPTLLAQRISSPRFGEVHRTSVTIGRSGNHAPGAFVLTSGSARPLTGVAHPEDIPATILAALGLPHHDLPGRPLL